MDKSIGTPTPPLPLALLRHQEGKLGENGWSVAIIDANAESNGVLFGGG